VFHVAALAQVRHCTWQESIYVLGLKFLARTTTAQNDPYSADHYELLRLSPGAEREAVERVYWTMAKRFIRIIRRPAMRKFFCESLKRTGCFPIRRNGWITMPSALRHGRVRDFSSGPRSPWIIALRSGATDGMYAGRARVFYLYNCEKGFARASDGDYCMTAEGVDFVEKKLAQDRGELLAIAAGTTPPLPSLTELFALGDRIPARA
jgi:hypothetical protein